MSIKVYTYTAEYRPEVTVTVSVNAPDQVDADGQLNEICEDIKLGFTLTSVKRRRSPNKPKQVQA